MDETKLADLIEESFRRTEGRLVKLQRKNPGHELLKYAPYVLEQKPWPDELSAKFLKRFASENEKDTLPPKAAYMIAVREALEAMDVDP